MGDEIRRLSEELAADPSSLVFLPLGEALRRAGQVAMARRVALRGLERHPHLADAHDLLARIAVDEGAYEQALDAWSTVLRLVTEHVGARKGLGYVLFKLGRLAEAEAHLAAAARAAGEDPALATALTMVQRARSARGPSAPPGDARALFDDLLTGVDVAALLVDDGGLVTAGRYAVADGTDVAQEVGAELSGVRDAVERTTSYLALGAWTAVVYETDAATVALAPAARDSLVLVAAARELPLGFVRRVLTRCAARATRWLEDA